LFDGAQPLRVAIRGAAVLLFGMWFTFSVWHFERALLPEPSAYNSRGRYGNLVTAQARAQQYQAVMEQLMALAAKQAAGRSLELPFPEKWSAAFFKEYTLLEWGGDYTSRGVTHLFWDMPAADPSLKLTGRWVPVDSLDESTRQRLMAVPWLAPAFGTNEAEVTP
jgi:hypothetical protein